MRRIYADYLKAYACITIVILHVLVNPLDMLSFADPNYYILSGLLHLTRWAVPVFTMVSGCNLLGREGEFSIAKKHLRHILRIAVIWGVIYVCADLFIDILVGKEVDPMEYLNNLFDGRAYALWYCFMIAGLYAFLPLLNPIVKSKKTCGYFILVCVFSAIVLPGLSYLGTYIRPVGAMVGHLNFPRLGLYICYFVLGYYIDRYMGNEKKIKRMLYVSAVVVLAVEIMSGIFYGMYFNRRASLCVDLTALLTSAAIYTWFRFDFKGKNESAFIRNIKQESLGIYLMHPYLIIRLSMKGINAIMIHPILAVPIVTALVVGICFAASRLLRKIPYLKNWLF